MAIILLDALREMTKKEYYFKEGCFITELHNTPDDPDVSVARVRVLSGEITKWHMLQETKERYLIQEGHGIAQREGHPPKSLSPGDCFTIEASIPQRIYNPGPHELIFLAICTPRFQEKNYVEVTLPD